MGYIGISNRNFTSGIEFPLVDEFYTLQGEGFHFGKAAYFLRIGGCDIGCQWCDTKQSWNPEVHPVVTINQILQNIQKYKVKDIVVTGGEPLMYPMDKLCNIMHTNGIKTYLETSGAYPLTGTWDWICLSPKKQQPPFKDIYTKADELKVIIYNVEEDIAWAEEVAKKVSSNCHLYLQPEWSRRKINTPLVIDYIKTHTKWKLSLQTHKYINIK